MSNIELIDNLPLTESHVAQIQKDLNRDIEALVEARYGLAHFELKGEHT